MINIVAQYIEKVTNKIPDELKSELLTEVSEIVRFNKITTYKNKLDEISVMILEYGLPKSCPGFINFTDRIEQTSNIYYSIGFNTYGDKVVINLEDGNIMSINHDDNDSAEYINNCINSFMQMIYYFDNADGIIAFANKYDPDSVMLGRHWSNFILNKTSK